MSKNKLEVRTQEILKQLPEEIRTKAKITNKGKISFAHLPFKERTIAETECMVAGLNYHTDKKQ